MMIGIADEGVWKDAVMIALFEKWFRRDALTDDDADVNSEHGADTVNADAISVDDDAGSVRVGVFELPLVPRVWYGVAGDEYVVMYHGGSRMVLCAVAHERGERMLERELGGLVESTDSTARTVRSNASITVSFGDNAGTDNTGDDDNQRGVVQRALTSGGDYRRAGFTVADSPVVLVDGNVVLTGVDDDTYTVYARISGDATVPDLDAYAEVLSGVIVHREQVALFPGDHVPVSVGDDETTSKPRLPLEEAHGDMTITVKADGTVNVADDNGDNQLLTTILQNLLGNR